MLIGAHVSTAGGLVKAHARGVEIGADAIQVFNQSPRMWKPTRWKDDDVATFRELMADGPIESVVIHAVYLVNCASKDPEMRKKSLTSLTHSLRMGDAIGADGVVLHPGSTVGEPHDEAIARVGEVVREALAESESCPLLLEDTAGAGNTLGRSFEELARLIELAGGHERLGLCLDSCHLLASGFDVRTADGITRVMDDCVAIVGERRLQCLHVNDSQTPLGSNRDRHAPLGDGELGPRGCGAFLSEPRFEGLPAIFEGPGVEGKAPTALDVDRARELRRNGLRARARRKPARGTV
jgi:deoxyribonuclease IV